MANSNSHPFSAQFQIPQCLTALSGHRVPELSFGGVRIPTGTIYLDYAASTPLHLGVFEAMKPWMLSYFGNPAARIHPMGDLAEHGLSQARAALAELLGLSFEEVIFTASATESNNMVLRGLVENPLRKGRFKILYSATEHSSIVSTAQALEQSFGQALGIQAVELPVDSEGQIDLDAAKQLIDEKTLCVCVMDVNNETGIYQLNLPEVIRIAHEKGALVHVDAVQGFARGKFHASNLDFDTAVISSAKIYGPKGAAALLMRRRKPRIRLEPQLTGGGHEAGLRSSTPNLPAIVGFVTAARLQVEEREARNSHILNLEETFRKELLRLIDARIYGSTATRAPGILMVCIPGANAMKLIEQAKIICVSVGSACKTLQATASHVLVGMGVELDDALASFRVSLGLPNTTEDAQRAARVLAETAYELRRSSATLLG